MTKLPNTDDDTNVFFELEEDYSVVHYENIKLLTFSEWISFIGAGLISAIYLIIIGGIHVLIFWVNLFSTFASSNIYIGVIIKIIYFWFSVYSLVCFFKPTLMAYNLNRNWFGSGNVFSTMLGPVKPISKLILVILFSPYFVLEHLITCFKNSKKFFSYESFNEFYENYILDVIFDNHLIKIDPHAGRVEHPHTIFIFLINIFFGATFFGYVVAHVWAMLGLVLKERDVNEYEDEIDDDIDEDEIEYDKIDEDEIDEKFLDTIVLNEIGIHYLKLSDDQIIKYEVYDDYKIKVLKTPIDLKLRRKNFKNKDDFEEFLKTVI